jgi:hypothetical protein
MMLGATHMLLTLGGVCRRDLKLALPATTVHFTRFSRHLRISFYAGNVFMNEEMYITWKCLYI